MVQKIAANLVRFRIPLLIIVLLVTVFFNYHYKRITVEYSAEKMLAEDDPERIEFQKFVEHFEIEEFFVVTFEAPDIFQPKILEDIHFLSKELEGIEVDKTGAIWPEIRDLRNNIRLNRWVMDKLPDSMTEQKGRIEDKIEKSEEKLAGLYPPEDQRLRVITECTSVLNATDVQVDDADIRIGPISPGGKVPQTTEEIELLRSRALSNPTLWNNIISRDGKTTAIVCSMRTYLAGEMIPPDADLEKQKEVHRFVDSYRREVAFRAQQILDRMTVADKVADLNIKYYLAGAPIFTAFYLDYIERDTAVFFPLTLLIIGIMLIIVYRNLRGVLLPIVIVMLSFYWTFGAIEAVGKKMTLVSTILFPLILVIGLAIVIHIMNQYYEEISQKLKESGSAVARYIKEGRPKSLRAGYREERLQIIRNTISHVFMPCFWTSATTALGFGSLAVSKVVPVAETGMFAAWGVMATFFIAITLTPIFLAIMPIQKKVVGRNFEKTLLGRLLEHIASFNAKHALAVVIASAVLLIVSIYLMTMLIAETNLREYFKESSPIRVAHKFMEERLSGVTSIEFSVDAKDAGRLYEPEVERAISEFQKHLESYPVITKTFSMADTVKMMNKAMHEGREEFYTVPDTRQAIAQYLLLYEQGRALTSLVDTKYSYTFVSARLHNMGSDKIRRLISDIESEIPNIFCDLNIDVQPAGSIWLAILLEKYIVDGQIESFALAMVVISIFMFLFLRSWRLGAIAIMPNLLPILMTMGFMGLVGIPINMATCMVPSIAIGIAVDDTIHFLNRYRRERKLVDSDVEATRRVMVTTGQAMILTSIVLFAGFAILLLSSFNPNIHFGALTALTMATALIGDLLLLPCLIILFGKKGNSANAEATET